jgi:uncharacterized membrane protein YvbJ
MSVCCASCGASCAASAATCASCGATIAVLTAMEASNSREGDQTASATPLRRPALVAIAGIVLLLIGLFLATVFFR